MQKKRPHILITNDDGIHAPGIQSLWLAIKEIADVTIVAPATEQSGVGLCTSLRQPLRLEKVLWHSHGKEGWSVSGTPADCIKMALRAVLTTPPDLVLSGINRGSNAGRNLLYSGTVAAVIESTLSGIPGVALSLVDYQATSFDHVGKFVPEIVEYVLNHPFPRGTFLNVNFPAIEQGEVKGICLTKQGKEYWGENLDKRSHPVEGHFYYWLGAKILEFEEDEDSDISWLRKGYAAAVPIHIDNLTDFRHLDQQRDHFAQFTKAKALKPKALH